MLRFALGLLVIVSVAGCERRSGEAIVLTKEYIAAAPPTAGKGVEEPSSSASPEEEIREIHDDEITVDGYVMKPEVRGTSRDPRALQHEQWRVTVQTISDGRTFNVPTDQSHFAKLKEGDRIWVTYHVGKYTGTVWGAEIEESKR